MKLFKWSYIYSALLGLFAVFVFWTIIMGFWEILTA